MRFLLLSICSLLIIGVVGAQSMPMGTKYVETIYATEFKKGDTVENTISVVYYDKNWKELYGEYGQSSASESERSIDLVTRPDYQVTAIVAGVSDTQYFLVRVTDSTARTNWTYQILNGDTVVKQMWVFDGHWKDYDLFNDVDGTYVKEMTFRFDNNGELVYSAWYDVYNNVILMEEKYVTDSITGNRTYYRSVAGGPLQVMSVSEHLDSSSRKTSFYYDLTGYVYGIEIQTQKGGFSITRKNLIHGNDLEETYNKKGVLTSRVRKEIEILKD